MIDVAAKEYSVRYVVCSSQSKYLREEERKRRARARYQTLGARWKGLVRKDDWLVASDA